MAFAPSGPLVSHRRSFFKAPYAWRESRESWLPMEGLIGGWVGAWQPALGLARARLLHLSAASWPERP